MKLKILLATIVLSFLFGWMFGRKYFTYVLFVSAEPLLHPCPYSTEYSACAYEPEGPDPNVYLPWHGWPTRPDKTMIWPASGKCLQDILFYSRFPPDPYGFKR